MKVTDTHLKKNNFVLALIVVLIFPLMAWAQDTFTLNTASGDWNETTHWDYVADIDNPGSSAYPGGTTGSTDGPDVVIIPAVLGYDVTLDADVPNPVGTITVASSGQLSLVTYSLEASGLMTVSGTVSLGSGANTFSGGITINSGADFDAGTGTVILGGDLTINDATNTFTESTATFQFPDPNAYVITTDGSVSFDKIEHTTTNTSGDRTLEFAGSGSPTITIKTSFKRSGNSQGTIANTASLAYDISGDGASLIYDPATSLIADVDEWPSGVVPNLVLQSGTVSLPAGTYQIDNKLTRVNLTSITGAGTIQFNSSNETTLEYAPSPAASITVGSEWPTGASTRPSNVTIINSGNSVDASGSDRVIPGTLTMTAGTLAMGSNNLSVIGTISGSDIGDGGTVTSTGTITMGNGSGTNNQFNQTITGNVTLSNLTINKADTDGSNDVTITGSPTITNNFVLANGDVIIDGSGSVTISSGSLTLNNGSTFTINSGSVTISSGSLIANNTSVFEMTTGATSISVGTLDLNNTATYKTGGKTISGLSTLTADIGTTFEFNGTLAESTPLSSSAFGNVNMNNSAGLNINGSVTINGTLTFSQDATINTDVSNLLTLSTTAAAVAGATNDNRYVNGPLRKQFSGTGSYIFPVGTSNQRAATFEWVSGTFGGTSIIEITHGGSFSAKTPPSGISSVDENTHYIVKDEGTAPTGPPTYNFTGTFENDNFSPETRNRAMPETAASYTLAEDVINVNTTLNTVQSGTFSALPVGSQRFVFGGTTLSGAVAWDGDTNNDWFEDTNWDGDFAPTSSNFVTIEGNVTVNIGGSSAAVCSTLTLGNGTNLATVNISSSNSYPLTIYETAETSLILEANSILEINISNEIVFGVAGSYDPTLTNYKTGSTVEYQSGAGSTVQVDDYANLVINDASGSPGSGSTINVAGNLTKEGTSNTFTSTHTINVTGSYTHTEGTATYSGGSGLTVSGSQFNLNGGSAGGTIAISSPTINVNGGSFGGTITFSGGSAQSLVPVVAASFNNLTMNKSANNLTISGSNGATVSGSLTLTQGLINTSSGLLTLSAGTTGSASSHIDGPLDIDITTTSAYTFPTGKGGEYLPLTIQFGSVGGTVTVSVEQQNSDPHSIDTDIGAGLTLISYVRYWDLTSSGGTFSDPQVTLSYNANDNVSVDETSLRIAQYNGTDWESIGGSGSALNVGTISSSSMTDFSSGYVTFGDVNGDNPLPVELVAFEALASFSQITLNWTTASEFNNLGFNIYRVIDGEDTWYKLNSSIIAGRGTASDKSDYSLIDNKITAGETYRYKLESVSINGLAVEERIIDVTVPVPNQYVLFNNYPNPFNPTTNIKFQLPEAQQIRLFIYDLNGSLVTTLVNNQLYPSGEHIVNWDATDNAGNRVATGIYLYRFQAGNFVKTGKMILVR